MSQYNTIGIDLGDEKNTFCVLDHQGDVIETGEITNSKAAIKKLVQKYPGCVVSFEVSTHSLWISELLDNVDCTYYVCNARKVRAIWDTENKNDRRDAEMLARLTRSDPKLLSPIRHRNRHSHLHLQTVRSRDMLVKTRTELINHVRGAVKAYGERVPKGIRTDTFAKKVRKWMPRELHDVFAPILDSIETITESILDYEKEIDRLCEESYPETQILRQITGVGTIISLGFRLTIENPDRFGKCRDIGPLLGLVPRRDQSGEKDRQLRTTRQGDQLLRRLLVQGAQYILGAFGPDCDLRRHGEKIAARGGKIAKKRAVTAVARKLAVLMLYLWKTGDTYDPDRNLKSKRRKRSGVKTSVFHDGEMSMLKIDENEQLRYA